MKMSQNNPPSVVNSKPVIDRNQLIGAWTFDSDSNVVKDADKPKVEYFSSKPSGTFIFCDNGRYAVILTNPDIPRFAINDRLQGTAEENIAVIRGVYAHFGTFTVDEIKGTFTLHVEGGSFPNDRGIDSVRKIELLTHDELRFTNDAPPTGDAGTRAYVNLLRIP
jgi:hypothetical protein